MKFEMDNETIEAIDQLYAECGLPDRPAPDARQIVASVFGRHRRGNREQVFKMIKQVAGYVGRNISESTPPKTNATKDEQRP